MKSRQFCSVCKDWLEMEVVPTSDGEEDDGVIWFRCPQCQGFLPKLSGAELKPVGQSEDSSAGTATPAVAKPGESAEPVAESPEESPAADSETQPVPAEGLPWDSPADMMEARRIAGDPKSLPALDDLATEDVAVPVTEPEKSKPEKEPTEPPEPIHEYAAMLEAKDQSEPTAYRPWETYEVGQCIHHMAWEDCGVVVAKENLPGGRQVIKCYFEEAGVVRLIEKAPK
jgi:hypothetical protein